MPSNRLSPALRRPLDELRDRAQLGDEPDAGRRQPGAGDHLLERAPRPGAVWGGERPESLGSWVGLGVDHLHRGP